MMKSFSLKASLVLGCLALTKAHGMQFQLQGAPTWINDFEFRSACRDLHTKEVFLDVLFICTDKKPRDFTLTNEENFPRLNLNDAQSCQSYFQRLSAYIGEVRGIRRQYMYSAAVGVKQVRCAKIPPTQLPLPCALDTVYLKENYDLKRLDLTYLSIFMGTEEKGVPLNATGKLQEVFGVVPFDPALTEGQSYLEQIVSTTYDLKGRVFETIGSIETFKIPFIPGIPGFEAPREERRITYEKGPILYEDAIASLIFSPQAENELIIFEPGEEEPIPEAATSSFSLSSYESAMEGEELDPNFDLHRHFKLVGDERRAPSPYIYNNGQTLFLTQTFEQDCVPFMKGETKEDEIFTLRYTRETSYPVEAKGFSPTKRPNGIYQVEGDSWMLLKGFYEVRRPYPAQRHNCRGPLTEMILSQTETYDLKTTLVLGGPLGEYVELRGQEKFAELVDQFKDSTQGILRVIGDLPEEKDYFGVPFLLNIRQRRDLNEPELLGYMAYDKDKNHNKFAWNFRYNNSDYLNLPLREKLKDLNGFLHIYTLPSLKLLPLITLTEQIRPGPGWLKMELRSEDYRDLFGSTRKMYAYMAPYLSLDGLREFSYEVVFNYEEDGELTIQPLAHCLRSLHNLISTCLYDTIGIKNLEYLIEHGLCQNRSIASFSLQVRGDYPIALLGRLLAKNTTLKHLSIQSHNTIGVSDYECFNELGRGLLKNKTLEKLSLNIHPSWTGCIYSDWQEVSRIVPHGYSYEDRGARRPLPNRPQGSTTCDFSVFEQALLESGINYIDAYLTHSSPENPSQEALRNMLKGLQKPGLEKYIVIE